MSERSNVKPNLWERLTRPHPGITDLQEVERARRLAALSLVLFAVGTPIILTGIFAPGSPSKAGIPSIVIALVSYLLSRTRWARIGSLILVFCLVALFIFYISVLPFGYKGEQLVPFILIPILLSTIILSARMTLVLVVGALLSLWIVAKRAAMFESNIFITEFVATTLISSLIVVLAFQRERDRSNLEVQTKDIDHYSRELEEDVRRITATAEVGQAITGTRDLETLLRQVTSLIIDRFDFYHAQIFLLDESRHFAVLRESTGEAGKKLLERKHQLAVGSQSVIGHVTAYGEPLVASDTDTDAVHRRNELLPNTRSEIALPLRIGGTIIGALDIQSENPNAFSGKDISVFQTMADQLAVAIQNARLFEQAQRDLQDIEYLNRQLTGLAWQDYLASRGKSAPVGYTTDPTGVRRLSTDELPQIEETTSGGTMSLPLSVRGKKIGRLSLKPKSGAAHPDEDTQVILEAVAERVALALDSTRLSEQAQQQAAREQMLSQISVNLQSSTNLDMILRTAAREASRAMGVSRGFATLAGSDDEPTRKADHGPELSS
ncbi:MAG: GAF domain-containing protein [Anaerolineae bacterium]|nr:GAF domain-containing protein [Anaerolineae bacterium]